ncbi:MAG: hypothetical protein M3Q46_11575 [Verrucomicrobiota bacterium]|nr:hypothetical protein [Verrucomicrobiota bacterium]
MNRRFASHGPGGLAQLRAGLDFNPERFLLLAGWHSAEGTVNQEMMVIGELNLKTIQEGRETGTVLPLRDSKRTQDMLAQTELVKL